MIPVSCVSFPRPFISLCLYHLYQSFFSLLSSPLALSAYSRPSSTAVPTRLTAVLLHSSSSSPFLNYTSRIFFLLFSSKKRFLFSSCFFPLHLASYPSYLFCSKFLYTSSTSRHLHTAFFFLFLLLPLSFPSFTFRMAVISIVISFSVLSFMSLSSYL